MPIDEILAQRVRSLLANTPLLVEKKMFGGIGFLVQGNMACGVHGDDLIVRLGPAEFEAAIAQEYVRVFDMTGKPMQGWIFVAPEGTRQEADLSGWVDRGVEFARQLPPK
jgi:hypothetical protein